MAGHPMVVSGLEVDQARFDDPPFFRGASQMKFTFKLTIVRFGEATRTVILTTTRQKVRQIVTAHEARGASVSVDVADWKELDSRCRPLTRL